MIDGRLKFSDTLEVSPDLVEDEFLSTPEGRRSELLIENEGFRSYRIRVCEIHGRRFIVSLVFKFSILVEVSLYPIENEEAVGGWEHFSEEIERSKNRENIRWLDAVLGSSERTFEWGTIEAFFDARVGASEILFRYSR